MPLLHLPSRPLTINYTLQGAGADTVVLINGLADDLSSWSLQLPALLAAGFRVLSFDNRGVGLSDQPAGPYTAELLADDTKALVAALGVERFHLGEVSTAVLELGMALFGVSMGGMIAQSYALKYPTDVRSLVLACTYAAPGPFCSRMFALWADMARSTGLAFVRRDTDLWCFTQRFYREREAELLQMEAAAQGVAQSVEAYLAQVRVFGFLSFRWWGKRGGEDGNWIMVDVWLRQDPLSASGDPDFRFAGTAGGVGLSRELWEGIMGAEWKAVKGGHAFAWEEAGAFNEAVVGFLTRDTGK
ncbi:hypothetical protein MMC17_007168 [Xylographa soralifera]|nr:hypothetical protein [Xylographa soralifera]